MSDRLLNWFIFNIFFALLPFGASVSVHMLNGSFTQDTIVHSPEILFYTLMISAAAITELNHNGPLGHFIIDLALKFCRAFFLIGIIISAFFYGNFLLVGVVAPGNDEIRTNLLPIATVMAVFFALASLVVQIFIGLAETSPNDS